MTTKRITVCILILTLFLFVQLCNGQTANDSVVYWVNEKYVDCIEAGKSVCNCQEENDFLILYIDTATKDLIINPSIYYSWETKELKLEQENLNLYKIIPNNGYAIDSNSTLTIKGNSILIISSKQTAKFTKINVRQLDDWKTADLCWQIGVINCRPLLKYSIKLCGDSTSFPLTTKILSDYISRGQVTISCSDDYHYNEMYIKSSETHFFLVYDNNSIKVYKEPNPRGRFDKVDISKLKDCQLFYKSK